MPCIEDEQLPYSDMHGLELGDPVYAHSSISNEQEAFSGLADIVVKDCNSRQADGILRLLLQ